MSGISTSYFPKPKLRLRFLALLLVFFALPRLTSAQPDVQAYQLRLETELSEGKITGREIITFLLQNEDLKATFDCGDLKVETIEGAGFLGFEQQNQQLIISLSPVPDKLYELEITYHGNPRRGIEFYPDLQQVNSAYFTSEWMICNPLPDDRAIFSLDLIVEDSLVGIANGELRAWEKLENGKSKYSWQQAFPSPAYTFGFIIGDLKLFEEMHGNTSLTYYAQHYSPSELKQIFRETASMLDFFEAKAGVSYPLSSYRQVLGEGAVSQEYGGFTIMRKNYGKQVLTDSSQINLAAHELAHQWWGNQLTCRSWNHFWLNEGMAVFMSSAFKEHRFGRAAYLADIEVYRQAWQKVEDKGLDKPLLFPDWSNPTPEDRTLVYYKGAYFLHLLREKLGEAAFWKGIQHYTQTHYGQSVESRDFQQAMEKGTGQSLQAFFGEWVY